MMDPDWRELRKREREDIAAKRRAEHEKRNEEGRIKREEQKCALALEHGLVNHPKLDLLYDLSWEYGHPDGLYAIKNYFDVFAELLKP